MVVDTLFTLYRPGFFFFFFLFSWGIFKGDLPYSFAPSLALWTEAEGSNGSGLENAMRDLSIYPAAAADFYRICCMFIFTKWLLTICVKN